MALGPLFGHLAPDLPYPAGCPPGPHRATRLLKCGGAQGAEFKCKCLTSGWEAVAAPHPPHHPACGWQASQSTSTAQSTVAFQGPAGGIWAPAISLLAGRASSALALIVFICSKRQASAVGHLGPRSSGGAGRCGYTWTSPFVRTQQPAFSRTGPKYRCEE